MCLIIFAYQTRKDFPLLVAANRDEFYKRASETSHFWPDKPDILAGRDNLANGTWLGISKRGRFAAITNGIETKANHIKKYSRGSIVVDFLAGEMSANQYAREVNSQARNFNGFHLIVYDMKSMCYVDSDSNTLSQEVCQLSSGIYGLSNAGIHSDWPKCEIGKNKMSKVISNETFDFNDLIKATSSRKLASKSHLEKLGLFEKKDILLSGQFVSTEDYGTRCSTAISISSKEKVTWLEKSFDSSCRVTDSIYKTFDLKINSSRKILDE
mgnify:CR=1 FL=1